MIDIVYDRNARYGSNINGQFTAIKPISSTIHTMYFIIHIPQNSVIVKCL